MLYQGIIHHDYLRKVSPYVYHVEISTVSIDSCIVKTKMGKNFQLQSLSCGNIHLKEFLLSTETVERE